MRILAGFLALALLAFLAWPQPTREDAEPWSSSVLASDRDPFSRALVDAAQSKDDRSGMPASLSSLKAVYDLAPEILERYFEANPAWRVDVHADGSSYAERRIQLGGDWKSFFAIWPSRLVGPSNHAVVSSDLRLSINFHGDPPNPFEPTRIFAFREEVTVTKEHLHVVRRYEDQFIDEEKKEPIYGSNILVQDLPLVAWFRETGPQPDFRLTVSAIDALESEFSLLLSKIVAGDAEAFLDSFARPGSPEIRLRSNPPSRGLYDAIILANPGEPGIIYLKGFELPNNKAQKPGPRERIGWSSDPGQTFYGSGQLPWKRSLLNFGFRMRVELWFIPDAGGKERKLMEKEFSMLPTVFNAPR